jgi:hypothetical protein
MSKWLRDGRASAAVDLLRDPRRKSRDLFPQAAVDTFVRDHLDGTTDRSWQLWRALSTELWLDAFQLA